MSKTHAIRFAVGDKVMSKKYGVGVVTDVNPYDMDFRYNVFFEDGTRVWYDGRGTSLLESGK